MRTPPKKWTLADLADFEAVLGGEEELSVTSKERREFGEALRGLVRKKRPVQRRRGLRVWLESRRELEEITAGDRVVLGMRATAILGGLCAMFVGIGIMRGLLMEVEGHGKVYHLWVFLAVALGLQWLFLIVSIFGFYFLRGQLGVYSLLKGFLGWLARRFSSGVGKELWKNLRSPAGGYASVIGWRLTRMTQGLAVCFNIGLIAGFLGCLWLFSVEFYWESTLVGLSGYQLYYLANVLSLPWAWSGFALPPEHADLSFDLLTKRFSPPEEGNQWLVFLSMALVVWGLLPRMFLWIFAWRGECRALKRLDFQEKRHRVLWRTLSRNERTTLLEGPADGVVLLNVGGAEVDPEVLKSFLLRKVRVHVEEEYEAAVLNEKGEKKALAAIKRAPLGVVFLVEGWALSPKQIQALYDRVKAVGGERAKRFLVLGTIRDGIPEPPDAEEFAQWENFVDGLRDPATEIVAYEKLAPVTSG